MVFPTLNPREEIMDIWERPSHYASTIESTMRAGRILIIGNGDAFAEITPLGLFCAKITPKGGRMVVQVLDDEIRGFSLHPREPIPSGQLPIEVVGDHTHDRNLAAETIADMLARDIAPLVGVSFENTPPVL